MVMPDKAERFHALHETGCFVIPNAWDAGSARILAHLGFAAIATTYLLPTSMEHLGANGTLIILAAFPLVGLIASILWAPETKGKQLH